jgi:hypothetical protein
MEQRRVFLVLIDISGYTRFTRLHRLSAMHAEQIISDLLESIIRRATVPLVAHEILGDSVNFYALADGGRDTAIEIRRQVGAIFDAFRLREGELISDCSLCVCQACVNVGKLHLKAVLHHGEAVFTNVSGFKKIAGEDVILAHRLLKSSVPEKEYVIETEAFYRLSGEAAGPKPEERVEPLEDIGEVRIRVSYPGERGAPNVGIRRSLGSELRMSLRNDLYYLKRLFVRSDRPFHNIEVLAPAPAAASQTALFATKTHASQLTGKPNR